MSCAARLSNDDIYRAVRAVTAVPAASLIEASEKLHTTLTYGMCTLVQLARDDRERPENL